MALSQYKDIFGKPGEGVHAERLFGLAFWDVFMTFILILVISYFGNISFVKTTVVTFTIATFIHMIFGVDTALVKMIKN